MLSNLMDMLAFQVFSCVSKLVIYKESCKAGILELQGSNGEKAFCFFSSKVSSSFAAENL